MKNIEKRRVSFEITAATLKAILCFIDAENTPKIAYDDDSLAFPLINKLKEMIGDKDGSQTVYCFFGEDEQDLLEQYYGVCKNIASTFSQILPYRWI